MQSSSNPINRWGFKRNEKGGFVIPKWIWAVAGIALMLAILIVVTLPNLYRSRLESARSAQMARLGYELAGAPEEPTKPAGPMIIRTASLALVTKEVDQARTSVERLVGQYQGYIDEIRVTSEAGLARRLTATLRIPANQLDNALAELKKLGRVTEETQKGEDVTAQHVDISARLSNARSTENRLLEILRLYTGKVQDILAVEKEIARVREGIERTEAQLKRLENQVRFATLNLRVSEEYKTPLRLPAAPVITRLRNAAVEGYHGLAGSVLGLVEFILGYGPSILFWCLVLFFPARWVWRRLRRKAAAS